MERPILDKIDLNILAILGRDCRTSYSKIGSLIGMTPKSVKARVKNMVHSGIIKFVVRVNPAAFGYRTANVLVRTNNGITKDDVIQRVRQFGDLAHHVHQMGRISLAALLINESWNGRAVKSLNDRLRPATISSIAVSELPVSTDLSETDLRIIKCLLQLGARAEISEIAKELGISEKTSTRRLDRMKEGRLLDFTLQCDPVAMIGYVQFCILIVAEKSHYRSVYERMYSEFQENILYHPSVIDPDDRLVFILFGENVFKVDSVLTKVDSFEGVKMADAYIVTEVRYYDDWIIREIEKRLLPLSRKSITVADTLNA
ncbi:MAG TPA: AsnC family transcriptional regulator [Nitrososphaeraceae archaeon]|jgi:DNA-binding Lrp family transcriptional regulator|nr:AsnC family transcriptional regulator [Nitrososphaeraceae archaeon]